MIPPHNADVFYIVSKGEKGLQSGGLNISGKRDNACGERTTIYPLLPRLWVAYRFLEPV